MTGFDYAADYIARARWARDHNDGHPKPAWSTGERLAVALLLGDQATLDAEGHTAQQAARRLADDLGTTDATAWITSAQAALRGGAR